MSTQPHVVGLPLSRPQALWFTIRHDCPVTGHIPPHCPVPVSILQTFTLVTGFVRLIADEGGRNVVTIGPGVDVADGTGIVLRLNFGTGVWTRTGAGVLVPVTRGTGTVERRTGDAVREGIRVYATVTVVPGWTVTDVV